MAEEETQLRILRYMRKEGKPKSVYAIAKAVGIERHNGNHHVKAMVKKGLLLPVDFSGFTLYVGQPFLMMESIDKYLDHALFPLVETYIRNAQLGDCDEPPFAVKEALQKVFELWLDDFVTEKCVPCLRPDLGKGENCNGKKKAKCSLLGAKLEGEIAGIVAEVNHDLQK